MRLALPIPISIRLDTLAERASTPNERVTWRDLVGAILDSTEIDPNRLLQQVLSYRTAEVTRAVVADEPPSRFVAMISSPPGRALDPRATRLVGSSWARERAQ